jgi:hypothetical protein
MWCALALVGLASPVRAETFVRLESAPGAAGALRLDTRDGAFAATVNVAGGISIVFHGELLFELDVAAPGKQRLGVGRHDAAQLFSFQAPDRAGLSALYGGRPCKPLGGRFVVHQASYDAAGQIERFAADFAQGCDGEPALVGSVRFNSDVPLRDQDGDGVIDVQDTCPAQPNPDQSDVDADGLGGVCDPVQGVTVVVLDGPSREGVSATPPLAFGPRRGIRAFASPAGGVSVRVADVTLDFEAPRERAFELGRYESGVSVTSPRQPCRGRGGRFEVLELELAPDGAVQHLAIDFQQRCAGSGSVLSGIVRFNSESIGAPELDVDADGVINLADSCPMDRNSDQANSDGDELGDACDPYPDQRDNLNACQVESQNARALSTANDEALATLLGQSVELRTENQSLRDENTRLRAALADGDGDGVVDGLDQCARTPVSDRIDRTGCTRAQFCERIGLVSFGAGLQCLTARFADDGLLQSCGVDLSDPARGAHCSAR